MFSSCNCYSFVVHKFFLLWKGLKSQIRSTISQFSHLWRSVFSNVINMSGHTLSISHKNPTFVYAGSCLWSWPVCVQRSTSIIRLHKLKHLPATLIHCLFYATHSFTCSDTIFCRISDSPTPKFPKLTS